MQAYISAIAIQTETTFCTYISLVTQAIENLVRIGIMFSWHC